MNVIMFSLSVSFLFFGLIFVFIKEIKGTLHKLLWTEKKRKLKEKMDTITGEINRHFFRRQMHETKLILQEGGKGNWFGFICLLSIAFGIGGIVMSVLMKNLFLLPLLPVVGAIVPFAYIKIAVKRYKKNVNAAMEDTLFALTYNYMTNSSFISVVKDNLELMSPQIQPFFKQLVTENTMINADIATGIHQLKTKINNPVFHEWCDCVIQCQNDSTLKSNLLPIVERMSDSHVIQNEVEALIAGAKRNAYIMLGMVCLCPLLFRAIPEWFAIYGTNQGKFSIALSALIVLFSVWKISSISKPIEPEESK